MTQPDQPAPRLEIHREADLRLLRDLERPWLHHMMEDGPLGIRGAIFVCMELAEGFRGEGPQVAPLAEIARRCWTDGKPPGAVLETGPDLSLLWSALNLGVSGLSPWHRGPFGGEPGPETLALRRFLCDRLGPEGLAVLRVVGLTQETSYSTGRPEMAYVLRFLSQGDRVARRQALLAYAPHAVELATSPRAALDADARRPLLPALAEALRIDATAARRLSLLDHRIVQWVAKVSAIVATDPLGATERVGVHGRPEPDREGQSLVLGEPHLGQGAAARRRAGLEPP